MATFRPDQQTQDRIFTQLIELDSRITELKDDYEAEVSALKKEHNDKVSSLEKQLADAKVSSYLKINLRIRVTFIIWVIAITPILVSSLSVSFVTSDDAIQEYQKIYIASVCCDIFALVVIIIGVGAFCCCGTCAHRNIACSSLYVLILQLNITFFVILSSLSAGCNLYILLYYTDTLEGFDYVECIFDIEMLVLLCIRTVEGIRLICRKLGDSRFSKSNLCDCCTPYQKFYDEEITPKLNRWIGLCPDFILRPERGSVDEKTPLNRTHVQMDHPL